jgi:hypothetical protein
VTLEGEETSENGTEKKTISLPNDKFPFNKSTSSITVNPKEYFEETKITITVASSDAVGNETQVISEEEIGSRNLEPADQDPSVG